MLSVVSQRVMFLALAGAIGVYLVTLIVHPQFKVSGALERWLSPVIGAGAGTLQGATGICGPVVGTYLHALRLDQSAYVFSVTAIFQVFWFTQLLALAQFGMFTGVRLVEGLIALVPILVVMPLSVRLSRLISRRVFDAILITLIAVMGLRFLYKGLWGG